MRAIVVTDSHDLEIAELDPPPARDDTVRIAVNAAGVNRADLLQRAGHYPPPAGASPILGLECAGRILEPGSSRFRTADRVMALLPGGGYADEVVVHAGSVMAVPDVLTDDEAGAFPEVFLTAFLNVFMLANAKAGETILIHGGGSGVGTAATTLAKLAGLRVVVTAGSDEKCAQCVEHGADKAINYRREDFVAAAGAVDIVLDHIGAPYLARDLQILNLDGRVIVIGSMGGERTAQIDVSTLLARRQRIIGSTLRSRTDAEKANIVSTFLKRFGTDLNDGRIRPVVHSVLPLERASEAHALMKNSAHFGKIVLSVSGSASTDRPRA